MPTNLDLITYAVIAALVLALAFSSHSHRAGI